MFDKMMSLFTGTGRNAEVVRKEPSHIHIQRPSRSVALDIDLMAAESGPVTGEAGEVREETASAVVSAA